MRRISKKRARELPERAQIRTQVFQRDGYECCLYGDPTAGRCSGHLTPHHLRKASQGGTYTPENLISLCAGHNVWVEDNPQAALSMGLVVRYNALS